jgi:hypothetical protein
MKYLERSGRAVAFVSLLCAALLAGISPASAAMNWEARAGQTVIDPTGHRLTVASTHVQPHAGRKGHAPTQKEIDHGGAVHTLSGSFWYAGGHQAPATAADGSIANVVVPTVTVAAGDHSLVEIDVEHQTGSGIINGAELGYNIDAALYGNSLPHLFIGAWKSGVFQGYNGGMSYTQIAGAANPGSTRTAGTAEHLSILHGGSPVGWYLQEGTGGAFGYFPDSAWTAVGGFTASDYNQGFGEVWDSAGAGTTCTDMGNGTLAAGLPTPAGDQIGSFLLGTQPSGNVNLTWFKVTPGGGATKYNVAGLSTRTGRFGGPGAC